MRLSTGLRNHLVTAGSLKDGLDGGVIRLYSGTPPASADDALPVGAGLLATISVDGSGTGVTFEAGPDAGLLLKTAAEVWEGTVDTTGEATWFRLVPSADADDSSTSALRIQGTVAVAGADMQITNTSLVAGATQTIDYFSLVMPSA